MNIDKPVIPSYTNSALKHNESNNYPTVQGEGLDYPTAPSALLDDEASSEERKDDYNYPKVQGEGVEDFHGESDRAPDLNYLKTQADKFYRTLDQGSVPIADIRDEPDLYTFEAFTKIMPVAKYAVYTGEPRLVRAENVSSKNEAVEPTINILIHGTFSGQTALVDEGWSNPNSLHALQVANQFGGESLALQWSGRLDPKDRQAAANALVEQLRPFIDEGIKVNIVTHSHGGTVAGLAIEQLEKGDINHLVTLAKPVNSQLFPLDATKVSHFVEAHSPKDMVQKVAGMNPKGNASGPKSEQHTTVKIPQTSHREMHSQAALSKVFSKISLP